MAILLTCTKSTVFSNITHYHKLIKKITALCYHRTFALSKHNINLKNTYVIVSKRVDLKNFTFICGNFHSQFSFGKQHTLRRFAQD